MSTDQLSRSECANPPPTECPGRIVTLAHRPLDTNMAIVISQYRKKAGYKVEATKHWCLKIGDDLFWELCGKTLHKSLVAYSPSKTEWEKQDWITRELGKTCLKSDAIEKWANDVILHMKEEHEMHNGSYDPKQNNCQHFVRHLWNSIGHTGAMLNTGEWSRESYSKVRRR